MQHSVLLTSTCSYISSLDHRKMSLAVARPISCLLPLPHFAFALQHPRNMDEMERPRSRCVDFIAGARSATHYACRRWLSLPIANPPNSAQLGGIPYHSAKLHPGPCNSVGMWTRTDIQSTDRQTHRRTWPQYISRGLRLTRNVITLKPSTCSGDAASCQITLTTCQIYCQVWSVL